MKIQTDVFPPFLAFNMILFKRIICYIEIQYEYEPQKFHPYSTKLIYIFLKKLNN